MGSKMSLEKIINGFRKAAVIAAVGLALALPAKAIDYEIIRLLPEDPNVNYSMLYSINNDGEIIGIYGELGDKIGRDGYPILWKKNFLYKDGIFKDLNIELGNYTHDVINDFGEILAKNADSPGSSSGIYKADGAIGLDFWGSDMNNKNEVCGYYGYLYRNGEKIDLSAFSGDYGVYATAINDHTQVTGHTYGKDEPYHAYIWDNNEMRIFKGPLSHNRAYDINNEGNIVGSFSGPGTFACMWDKEGNITQIGDNWSRAYSINDKNQIVGEHGGAFLYDHGKMIYLNNFLSEDSEWLNLIRATNINNKGQIIGYGYLKEFSHYNYIGFLANPIPKPKTLEADLNDDGIVNGFDLAEFANQWLEREEEQGTLTLFQEDFENAPIGVPYPWNEYNNDEWYSDAYNRAVNISNFPEHNREFLGNNVLYLEYAESRHLIPTQTSPVKFEYDFLFHYSAQSPSGCGSTFGNYIMLNNRTMRADTVTIHIQKDYDWYPIQEDGIFWSENYDSQLIKIGEIIPDTWYHIERIVDPNRKTEELKIVNRDILQEFTLSYSILTPIETIEGFSLGANYSPSYSLMDNLKIEKIIDKE